MSMLRSPRSNLHAILRKHYQDVPATDAEIDAAQRVLLPADAENKLHHRMLYLIVDLDETLVHSSRMEAGASPRGTRIFVRRRGR